MLVRINLKNTNLSSSVVNISTKATSLDPCASVIAFSDPVYDDIGPGEIAEPNRGIRLVFSEECPDAATVTFAIDIFSDGYKFWSDTLSVDLVTGIVSSSSIRPTDYALEQNFPNPFNPTTTIGYQLPQSSEVDLSIYNQLGQKVATLVSAQQQAGRYQYDWDASGFASGVYFYILRTTTGFMESRKLILLK